MAKKKDKGELVPVKEALYFTKDRKALVTGGDKADHLFARAGQSAWSNELQALKAPSEAYGE